MKRLAILLTLTLLVASPLLSRAAFTADLSHGKVSIKVESEPDKISPAREVMLRFTVESPANLKVSFPDLQDRFSGFSLAEDFTTDPVSVNGVTRQVYRWRLVPKPAEKRYRLAPFAVQVEDNSSQPPALDSFATRPVVFPQEGAREAVTGDPEVIPEPVWIPPTARTIALWGLFAVLGLLALSALIWGLTRISRTVKEARMTPVERAMAELDRLLNRNLPRKGLYKEFYIELTLVVRRYIERRHGIRAPEQTTEEFLAAAASHRSFKPEVLASLRTFLESADLVKFAGQVSTEGLAEQATDRAKGYLTEDARSLDAGQPTESKK